MEKLELKHLAPYLPHGLEVEYFDAERGSKPHCRIEQVHLPDELTIIDSLYEWDVNIKDVKPLLIPLTEFQKRMTGHEDWSSGTYHTAVKLNCNIKGLMYWEFELLVKHHFDVFGLINLGLAIQKATL